VHPAKHAGIDRARRGSSAGRRKGRGISAHLGRDSVRCRAAALLGRPNSSPRALPAAPSPHVRDDRVVYLDLTDQFAGALGFARVLSLPYLLDKETDALAAAVDGDRKTPVDQPT